MSQDSFEVNFTTLTGNSPFPWQEAMYSEFLVGQFRRVATLPTGLGKTSVIAVWLLALARNPDLVPRRLVYVVNRRTVVDQSTAFAEQIRTRLGSDARLKDLATRLRSFAASPDEAPLAISTLRGQFADNGEWSKNPARPAVVVGTIDLIGSRLLFSGYRAGFKTRPLFAGFLGQDVLLVHDEAHLEPAFQRLLTAIYAEQRGRKEFRPFHVMALTATARSDNDEPPFSLTENDLKNEVVKKRLYAKKRLNLHSVDDEKKLVPKMIDLALAHKDSGQAILVFARTVEAVHDIQKGLIGKDRVPANKVATLTGTMRGLERDRMADANPVFSRFLPRPADGEQRRMEDGTIYLICTAAGEVGVDISADHLVCDLTPFDSMAQRFGRVNRYGFGDACIDVVYEATPNEKKRDDPFDQRRWLTLELLRNLNGEASPAALRNLPPIKVQDAFTPTPDILQTSEILFDSWAMTTIREALPGRPPVADWLHGVAEWQPPETHVAWRQEVWELRRSFATDDERKQFEKYAEELLDDYPLKPQELLRDNTARVFKHLSELVAPANTPLWIVSNDDSVQATTLSDLVQSGEDAKNVIAALAGRTILLPPQAGGLPIGADDRFTGLLSGAAKYSSDHHTAYDMSDEWFEDTARTRRRRIRVWDGDPVPDNVLSQMRLVRTVEVGSAEEDTEGADETARPQRLWRWYVRPWSADDDGSRSARQPQHLQLHLEAAERFARLIATKLGLSASLVEAVALAARHHDRGKHRAVWQRSIGNTSYPKLVLAKSSGGMRATELSHYRHEFGSLLEADAEIRDHPERDLILHLIATHHGRGRPHFPANEAFDPAYPDARCAEIAREVPRRFARLQRRFGRWGLAYLESLLRAADYLASEEATK